MGKRYLNFQHLDDNIGTYCVMKHKGYIGVGVALYNENGEETHPSKLMGETIAYLKAERDILRQKLADKKQQWKYVNDFSIYMFPKKYDATLRDWIYPRGEKYLTKIQNEIEELQAEIDGIDKTIVNYLNDKREFLQKLAKKRKEKENGNDSTV